MPNLPPYAYVPGLFPHPQSDPAGHHHTHPVAVDPTERFAWGVSLFNQGFYWEAHEVWESLWLERGRSGPEADFLKGLIRLAACGVKHREQRADGVADHAQGAARLFQRSGQDCFGLRLEEMLTYCEQAEEMGAAPAEEPPVRVVFAFVLRPNEREEKPGTGDPENINRRQS
jgi:hypothetical protein